MLPSIALKLDGVGGRAETNVAVLKCSNAARFTEEEWIYTTSSG